MSQCEETEAGGHPPETPLCEQHGIQSEAQRLNTDSFEWRHRLRSKSPMFDFKKSWAEDPALDPEADDGGSVQSADHLKKDNVIQETHARSGMETFLKHLPSATSAGLFTASCLLLLPLIIILRRSS